MTELSQPHLTIVLVEMVLMMSSPALCKEVGPCDYSGCCSDSNYGRGPLNLTQSPNGYDAMRVNEKTFVYHCVENFTSFLWYKIVDGNLELFPWAKDRDIRLLRHNQTVQILYVQKEDAAEYVYIASNGTSNVTGNFTLDVNCEDHGPSFATKEQPVQEVELGVRKTLQCRVNPGLCSTAVTQPDVIWLWWDDVFGNETLLQESGLKFVDVVCDDSTKKDFGQNCTVHIRHVEERHYKGQFICLVVGEGLNQTVRLRPPETHVVTWLPIILPTAVSVLVLTILIVFISWRYGYRITFACRPLPDRGDFEHDAVIVHGEDHEQFAREHLQPRLEDFGYDVMEEVAKPGRPENLEKANAILSSYCVILTFSERELRDQSTVFLTKVSGLKAGRSVLFIRCPEPTEKSPLASGHVNAEREVTSDRPIARGGDETAAELNSPLKERPYDVWSDEGINMFTILKWPGELPSGRENENERNVRNEHEQNVQKTESRAVERFWYQLRKKIPKAAKGDRAKTRPASKSVSSRGRKRQDFSSTGSEQRLLGRRSTDRISSRTSEIRAPSQPLNITTDVEAGMIGEESDANTNKTCALPDSCVTSLRTSENMTWDVRLDDVFDDVPTGNTALADVHLSVPMSQAESNSHDFGEEERVHSSTEPRNSHDVVHNSEKIAQASYQDNSAATRLQISSQDNSIPSEPFTSSYDDDVRSASGSLEHGVDREHPNGFKGHFETQESGYHSLSPVTSPTQNLSGPPVPNA